MRATWILAIVLLVVGAGCTSEIVDEPAAKTVDPQVFDFTQTPDGEDEGPVDPATCRHEWAPLYTHPYQYLQNGLPVTRLCAVIRCQRCGLERHECNNPEARP